MDIEKILLNHTRTGLFNFFTDNDITNWSFNNLNDEEYILHKIYNNIHLYMIIYIKNKDKDNGYTIYQYYYELKNNIEDDGTCPIINGKVRYETNKNVVLINNELYMICHQDYIYNELLLMNFTKGHILYDNGVNVYTIEDNIIENNNYIFSVNNNEIVLDIFINIINKTIQIYENNKLENYLNFSVHDPNI